jgi:hypothetical protein
VCLPGPARQRWTLLENLYLVTGKVHPFPADPQVSSIALALGVGPLYLGSKPRFLLPAVLLSVPVARLLAPLPAWLLGLVIGVLGAASVWFSLFLMTAGWAP